MSSDEDIELIQSLEDSRNNYNGVTEQNSPNDGIELSSSSSRSSSLQPDVTNQAARTTMDLNTAEISTSHETIRVEGPANEFGNNTPQWRSLEPQRLRYGLRKVQLYRDISKSRPPEPGPTRFAEYPNLEILHSIPKNQRSTNTGIFRVVKVRKDPVKEYEEAEKADRGNIYRKCRFCGLILRGKNCYLDMNTHHRQHYANSASRKKDKDKNPKHNQLSSRATVEL
jgi:hypothetical protein